MKQILGLLGACATSVAVLVTGAEAQQNETPPTPVIEVFPCTYRDNNDMDNLRSVNARFNTWADRNNVTTYTAFTLTPYAYSADLEADVLWLGAWPNGAAMGDNEALWLSQGGDVSAAFDAVVECNSHSLYAEVVINQPSTPPPETGVAMFEDCTVHDGRTVGEAIAAATQWVEYTKARGAPDGFSAFLFPLAGLEGDADYDFKVVTGFDSMQAFGRATDLYTGGGFLRAEELFGRLLTCNSPRVYTLERVRLAATPPAG
jgi:hypothetical protein